MLVDDQFGHPNHQDERLFENRNLSGYYTDNYVVLCTSYTMPMAASFSRQFQLFSVAADWHWPWNEAIIYVCDN